MPQGLIVLISGNGTNLQAIIDACEDGAIPANVVHVFSNSNNAGGLQKAENANIPHTVLNWSCQMETRKQYVKIFDLSARLSL